MGVLALRVEDMVACWEELKRGGEKGKEKVICEIFRGREEQLKISSTPRSSRPRLQFLFFFYKSSASRMNAA